MKRLLIFIFLLTVTLLFTACDSGNNKVESAEAPEAEETISLTISAAVSLTDALEEMKEIYKKENNVELTFNLAGSGTLAQQIQQGAPVDLFISANQQWMDTLEEEGIIINETRADVTGNKLVLIAGEFSDLAYESFDEISSEDVEQIAIGNPESVPAGKYSENTLNSLGLYDQLENQLVLAKDVRQVLTYVETGNTDIGFVYESDARSSDLIKILATADEGLHDPIIYPGAVIADTKHEEEAKDFLIYFQSDEAQDILADHGFRK